MIIDLPHKFLPRHYQNEALRAFFIEKYRNMFLVMHRRAGKDKLCINIITAAAMQRIGTYLYIFPQTNQARKVIWRGMDSAGMRFIDHIPQALIKHINNSEMTVELINGSIIMVSGSNNYNALMGMNPMGFLMSEFMLHDINAFNYLSPIVGENGGWRILQGTPRGAGDHYDLFRAVSADPAWFVRTYTIEQTYKLDGSRVITQEFIDAERRRGMPEELIQQEFYADWDIGNVGSYYTKEMNQAYADGRIRNIEFNRGYPVYTSWDIGVHDATAICFYQHIGNSLFYIDYYEMTDEDLTHYAEVLREKTRTLGYRYAQHFGPHDLRQREWTNKQSRVKTALGQGINFTIVPRVEIEDRIHSVKVLMPFVHIDPIKCERLIKCLRAYRREWDDANMVFKQRPLHDWSSNGADSMSYGAVGHIDLFLPEEKNNILKYKNNLMAGVGSVSEFAPNELSGSFNFHR